MTNELKDEIVAYIKENQHKNLDSIAICARFKNHRLDVTYKALRELDQEGRIHRHDHILGGWNGNHHYTA